MNNLEKYNKYIKGEMTESELVNFTKVILKTHYDDESRKEKYRKILESEHDIHALKKVKEHSKHRKNPFSLNRLLAIAAGFLLLVMGIYNYQSFSKPAYAKLLSKHLEASFPYSTGRKEIKATSEQRLKAVDLYVNKKYAEAAATYEKFIANPDRKEEDLLYLGLSYLYQNKSDEAIKTFTAILQNTDAEFEVEAKWFLALAYLQAEDFDKTIIYLKEIEQQKWHGTDASKLLKHLNELN